MKRNKKEDGRGTQEDKKKEEVIRRYFAPRKQKAELVQPVYREKLRRLQERHHGVNGPPPLPSTQELPSHSSGPAVPTQPPGVDYLLRFDYILD